MKKMTKIVLTLSIILTPLLGFPIYAQDVNTMPAPEIENFELVEYLTIGETGKIESKKEIWNGVPIEYDLDIWNSDPTVLDLNNQNEFKALKEGKINLSWEVSYSKETLGKLHQKWPGQEFPLPLIPFTATVYVTNQKPVYRLYHSQSGEHLFTTDKNEYKVLSENGWNAESSRWLSENNASLSVHRLYNPNAGDHHYTHDLKEIENLKLAGWKDEGSVFYSFNQSEQTIPVYRLYNPNANTGSHHFTENKKEANELEKAGWKFEGIAYYAKPLRTDLAGPIIQEPAEPKG